MLIYSLCISLLFAALYYQSALARAQTQSGALVIAGVAFAALLFAFLAPPRIYRYSNSDIAPDVMSQLMNRAMVASVVILALNATVWLWLGGAVSVVEELYMYALVAIFLLHGLGGVMAPHVVYLQATQQYNSNQLAAILLLVTFVLLILILFFVALDWATPKSDYIHLRDLTLITLALAGYGRAIYLMAHH